jgi:hypothetical protein
VNINFTETFGYEETSEDAFELALMEFDEFVFEQLGISAEEFIKSLESN